MLLHKAFKFRLPNLKTLPRKITYENNNRNKPKLVLLKILKNLIFKLVIMRN